jgi:hypothetical protein
MFTWKTDADPRGWSRRGDPQRAHTLRGTRALTVVLIVVALLAALNAASPSPGRGGAGTIGWLAHARHPGQDQGRLGVSRAERRALSRRVTVTHPQGGVGSAGHRQDARGADALSLPLQFDESHRRLLRDATGSIPYGQTPYGKPLY